MIRTKSNIFGVALLSITLLINTIGIQHAYSAVKKKNKGAQTIQFNAKDGFHLSGELLMPTTASVKNKTPLVVFIHSLGESSDAWMDLPEEMSKALNVSVVSMDLRGHGKSIKDKKNKSKYWTYFKDKDYNDMTSDVSYLLDFLKTEYPEVNINKTAIVSAGFGSSVAVISASKDSKIKTLVLISPSNFSKGIDIRLPLINYGVRPVLYITSKKDLDTLKAIEELKKCSLGTKKVQQYPDGGQGTNLIKFQPSSKKLIEDWVKSSLK
ncbi:MAG: alpha/beta fold hydrolase [bacterium]